METIYEFMLIGSGNLYRTTECVSKEGSAMNPLSCEIVDFLIFTEIFNICIHI